MPYHGLQESEGVESEYADDQIDEVDELNSEDEGEVSTPLLLHEDSATLTRGDTLLRRVKGANGTGHSPSKMARIQATAERQARKEKRKAAEGELQAKREVMDKAKVRPVNVVPCN